MGHHVTMIGAAFAGNKGAAAMLISSIESVIAIDPDASFSLFSMYPDEDRIACEYSQVEIVPASPRQLGVTINCLSLLYKILPPLRPLLRRKSRAIRALSKSSMFLDQMGVSFTDGREVHLLYNTAALLPPFLMKVPVVKCAQALGPFQHPLNKTASKLFLSRVSTIISRGEYTHRYLINFGLNNVRPGADAAFLLAEKPVLKSTASQRTAATARTVGIVPSQVVKKRMDRKNRGVYEALMVQITQTLVSKGHSVKIIAHSARESTSTQNNDLMLCQSIMRSLGNTNNVFFMEEIRTISQLRQDIGSCDVVLTGRFHAMVSSLALAVPTVVMGWGHKYKEVLEMFGLSENAVPHQECTHDLLVNKMEEALKYSAEQSQQIRESLPSVTTRAKIQDVVFSEFLSQQ